MMLDTCGSEMYSLRMIVQTILAIDIGNSRVNFAIMDGKRRLKKHDMLTSSASDSNALERNILTASGGRDINGVAIASVVPKLDKTFKRACINAFAIDPIFITPKNAGMKIRNYNGQMLGIDRLLNALAAYEIHGKSAIVVDAGTCTTFDAVSNDGEYLGGMIIPGIQTWLSSMNLKTERLPMLNFKFTRDGLGKNTKKSIQAGLCHGYAGAIERILNAMTKEIKFRPDVIATGGDAKKIRRLCGRRIQFVHDDLTIRGIYKAWLNITT